MDVNQAEDEDPCAAVTRPMRADAQRNRARVLEAAEAVFAAEGLGVPVDVIAEKAGVGVGTLYRHFPTKEKLFEAIFMEWVETLTAEAKCRATADDPVAAFFGFLDHVVEVNMSKRDLIMAIVDSDEEFEFPKEAMLEALGLLLERAKQAGAVRPDVTGEVVMSLVSGCCMAGDHGADPTALLPIIYDGLRFQRAGDYAEALAATPSSQARSGPSS